jgi:D-alanyl-lipoteichoic acid acyltransferase DltB (MBOAT superfamily)
LFEGGAKHRLFIREEDGMLFNSHVFIFAFLPIVLLISRFLSFTGSRSSFLWFLTLSSIVFYSWHSLSFASMFMTSIGLNYVIARQIRLTTSNNRQRWLWVGVAANLIFLGYFKYLGFGASILRDLFGANWQPTAIMLKIWL